jgi:hypothetical protein
VRDGGLHREALDRLLAVIANSGWGADLVLRGSMTLQAWAGAQARPPGDLDWIVPARPVFPDPEDPWPYIDEMGIVQQWPEADAGAAGYEIWSEEEFGTFGQRPRLPPEGLRWMRAEEYEPPPLRDLLAESVAEFEQDSGGVVLQGDGVRVDEQWGYSYGYDAVGTRLVVPWRGPEGESGWVQVDFAADQWLPEPPVWTAVPRADGGPPTVVRTASRGLSLAWKLLWLHTDAVEKGGAAGKDLYDAVILSESPRTVFTAALSRRVLGARATAFGAEAVRGWRVDWDAFRAEHPGVTGELDSWLERLARSLRVHRSRPEITSSASVSWKP